MKFRNNLGMWLFALAFVLMVKHPAKIYAQNPLANRARAYLDQNNLKLAVENFGRLAGVVQPYGLWGDFQYVSNLSFVLGIPGKDAYGRPYAWAKGAKKIYDVHRGAFYTAGNDTTYWGPTVSESWSDDSPQLKYTDWEAVGNLNNPQCTVGAIYGNSKFYTQANDSTPLIATATIPQSWPRADAGRFWPGPWATDFNDPAGREELRNVFVSDEDIYFAFNDRYATRDSDLHQGYPTGVQVEVAAHVFTDSLFRDMIFFDLQLVNRSVYDYQHVYAGLYLDADVYAALADGHYYGRSNDDDAVGFDPAQNLAYFYDLDGDSLNPYVAGKQLAWVGLKLLKAPRASDNLDLNGDGNPDVRIGEPLPATGFHWFDWYHRPGIRYVQYPEQDARLLDAPNKEEIQYKILAGDTSGLTPYDSLHFFHAGKTGLNPHFDSPEALLEAYPKGLDAVVILSTGPFDLPGGARQPLSFCLIMATNKADLLRKAQNAQKARDSNYRIVPSEYQRVAAVLRSYRLDQNYPNPFNGKTRIVFTLPEAQHVTLELFDTRGRKVRTYYNKRLRKGQHTLILSGEGLASGLYFYRLVAGQKIIAVKKLLLLR